MSLAARRSPTPMGPRKPGTTKLRQGPLWAQRRARAMQHERRGGFATQLPATPAVAADFAVRDVSVAVARGSLTGLLGPNGCGKTTLLKLLSGVLRPTPAQVTLDGRSARRRCRAARRRSASPSSRRKRIRPSTTRVLEMVLMGRHPHLRAFQLEGPDDLAIARDALTATGTAHLAERAVHDAERRREAARGHRQRAGAGADVLLLDEPTASLDLGYQLEIAVAAGAPQSRARR